MSDRRNHIIRCSIAVVAMLIGFVESLAQLPVRTRDLQLISNNNTNYTSVQAVNGQAVNWSLILPSSAGSTGSLLRSSVAGTAATLSWLPPSSDGDVLQLAGGVPTWSNLSGTFWALTGNATTGSWNGLTGSFLGTTSAQDLVMNTNGVFRARLVGGAVNTGNMVIGYRSDQAAPLNSTAAQATDRLTILGGDLSLQSENNSAIVRGIYFRGTSGGNSGRFRIGSDGTDIFWQGGGGQMLQMGSYWGIRFYGNQGGAGYPAFVGGAANDPTLNLIVTRTTSPGLVITGSAGMTADMQQWIDNGGTVLSMVDDDGDFGIGVTTAGSSKLRINSSATAGNAIQIDPWGAGAGNTGQLRFLELAAGGTNYVAFKAPDALAADNPYTLPTAYPAVDNYVLVSTAAGTMSWANPVGLVNAWALTGNSGTNPAANFLGTIDNVDLVLRTNNTEALRILSTGLVGIGTSAPSQLLEVEDGNVLISTSGAGTAGELRMEENAANGNEYLALKASASMANSTTYTMPASIGAADQYLRIAPAPAPTATTATLEWATITAVALPVVEQFNVAADNTAIVQQANTTYIRLLSDGLAANRTTTIANGTTDGQLLTIRTQAAGANGVQFLDAGNMRLSGAFNMNNNDSISLIWDANEGAWIETARRNN